MPQPAPLHNDTRKLADHANAIRALAKRALADIIEIGRHLIDAKTIAGHGNWLPWLKREFGWSVDTAQDFMNVAEAGAKFGEFPNLNVPYSALVILAKDSTPPATIARIAERSNAGERLSVADVKREISLARTLDMTTPQPSNVAVLRPFISEPAVEIDLAQSRADGTARLATRAIEEMDLYGTLASNTDMLDLSRAAAKSRKPDVLRRCADAILRGLRQGARKDIDHE